MKTVLIVGGVLAVVGGGWWLMGRARRQANEAAAALAAQQAQQAAQQNNVKGRTDPIAGIATGIAVTLSGILSDDRVQGGIASLAKTAAMSGKAALQGLSSSSAGAASTGYSENFG